MFLFHIPEASFALFLSFLSGFLSSNRWHPASLSFFPPTHFGMKKRLSIATVPALFIVPTFEMLLVGFKIVFDVVLSSFGSPLCGTDGKITQSWMKLRSSGDSQCGQSRECVNDWGKQADEAVLHWSKQFSLWPPSRLCVSWRGDMLIAWSYTQKLYKTWAHGSYLQSRSVCFYFRG